MAPVIVAPVPASCVAEPGATVEPPVTVDPPDPLAAVDVRPVGWVTTNDAIEAPRANRVVEAGVFNPIGGVAAPGDAVLDTPVPPWPMTTGGRRRFGSVSGPGVGAGVCTGGLTFVLPTTT